MEQEEVQVVQRESQIRSTEVNVVIEGIEKVIKRDLEKHKMILERTKLESLAFKAAVSNEIKRKKYYKSLLGGGKFNDESLRNSIDMINVNIRHMSDNVKISNEKIEHNSLIVDTLTKQLEEQYAALKFLSEYRDKNASSN